MELDGNVSDESRKVLDHFNRLVDRFTDRIEVIPCGHVKDVLISIHNDCAALAGTVIRIAMCDRASSVVIAVLHRSLIDALASMLAFLKDPESRATLFHDFQAILDWKRIASLEKHDGCPFARTDAERKEQKQATLRTLARVGQSYLKERRTNKHPKDAIEHGKWTKNLFRNKWYPETTRELFEKESMGWYFDIIYPWLCSAVHVDAAGGKLYEGMDRNSIITVMLEFEACLLLKVSDVFKVSMTSKDREHLERLANGLRWPKSASSSSPAE